MRGPTRGCVLEQAGVQKDNKPDMKNNGREVLQAVVLILGLAFLANGLWLAEVIWMTGWEGLGWLWQAQYSAYAGVGLAILAYLLPFILIGKARGPRLWISAIELFFSSVVAFLIARNILYGLYGGMAVLTISPHLLYLMLAALLALVAGSFYLTTQRRLARPGISYYFWLFAALGAPGALSLFTVKIFPGFGSSSTFADAVKMGYPLFWTVLCLGAVSLLGVSRVPKPPEYDEKILDDVEF